MAADEGASQRVTFNLSPKGRRAMEALLTAEFGTNQTDVLNRAVVLAQWLYEEAEHGAEIEVRHRNQVAVKVVFL